MTLPRERHPLADQPEVAFLVECLAASVCHATNWDRLRGHVIGVAAKDPHNVDPKRLAGLEFEQFIDDFGPAFADEVDDLPRRHGMFTRVAAAFADGGVLSDVRSLTAGPQALAGPAGLYARLDRLEPFRADPQRKKARVFVQQLLRFRLLTPLDPAELRPATEYHLIRLYLRTQRVTHMNGTWPAAPAGATSDLENITSLRGAVEQAMRYTAEAAGLTIADVNEIEWQVGRSYCERDAPRCSGPFRPDKPVSGTIARARGGRCPFGEVCDAARDSSLARLIEPQLASHHAFY